MSIVNQIIAKSPLRDQLTLSNYEKFNVVHSALHLHILFEEKLISGTIKYLLEADEDVKELVLDTSFLDITSVKVDEIESNFKLLERRGTLGSALVIPTIGSEVLIEFKTTEKCTAVQFVQGDNGEFVFSQCQAIHARSLFPCFDTPSVKSPYRFTCASKYPSLMSGTKGAAIEGLQVKGQPTVSLYEFHQPVPIPSYLVSVTSGKLESAVIGPRSLVYSEQPNLANCQWEFQNDMEDFIKVAEDLIFAYEWSTFDILVLPSSFPYGGMEIPNVIQVTPTIISKDRTQIKLVAHELAHSWAGNLVTNSSWSHFWLNEGWTVYLERRILASIATAEKVAQGSTLTDAIAYGGRVRDFEAILGWNALVTSVEITDPAFTSLIWDFSQSDADTDDAFSRVPYEKGSIFLYHIEKILGGYLEFDPFIKHYFKKFRFLSLDSAQFVQELYNFYTPLNKGHLLDEIEWDAWLFGKGLPEYPDFDPTLANVVYDLAGQWNSFLKLKSSELKFSDSDLDDLSTNQKTLFLDLLEKLDFTPEIARQLPKIYPSLHLSKNTEILTKWNGILISHSKWDETNEQVRFFANWLGTVGRMKYVRPGYKLLESAIGRTFAVDTFTKFASGYHPICREMIKKDLGISDLGRA